MLEKVKIAVTCPQCGQQWEVEVFYEDYIEFTNGSHRLVQNTFSYLKPEERELFLSHICPDCWDRIMADLEAAG